MSIPYDKTAAIVVLPAVGGGRVKDHALRRWLARAELRQLAKPGELLGRILEKLNRPSPRSGLGALRMWGQTGDRPTVWIAAADPVYLEPRLDHLRLHAQDSVPAVDLGPLIDHLQTSLGNDSGYGFARLGMQAYLRADAPIATPDVPPYVAHLELPSEYQPTGEGADAWRSLVSEVEMSLHEHEVNLRRQDEGLQPVNSFWFWGGGFAPEKETVPHPPLFTDDPLLTGYWLSKTGVGTNWPGDITTCVEQSIAGFVAVVPGKDDTVLLENCLHELRGLLQSGRLSRLTLMFADGIEARVERLHRLRAWRRSSELLD